MSDDARLKAEYFVDRGRLISGMEWIYSDVINILRTCDAVQAGCGDIRSITLDVRRLYGLLDTPIRHCTKCVRTAPFLLFLAHRNSMCVETNKGWYVAHFLLLLAFVFQTRVSPRYGTKNDSVRSISRDAQGAHMFVYPTFSPCTTNTVVSVVQREHKNRLQQH